MSGLVYLASPYSHEDAAVQEYRFRVACRVAANLMGRGVMVFSPIAHSHPIALAGKLPTDWRYWAEYDKVMLEASGRCIVARMPGWELSRGVRDEMAYMRALGKPVEMYDPTADELILSEEPDQDGTEAAAKLRR
jgi:hypothetical protein